MLRGNKKTCSWIILTYFILALLTPIATGVEGEHDPDKPGAQAGWASGYYLGEVGRKLPFKSEQLAIAKRAAQRKQVPLSERSQWMSNFLESFIFGFVAGSEKK